MYYLITLYDYMYLPDFFSVEIYRLYYLPRFKNRQKADITVVDKKIPNGILEEQGTVSSHLNFSFNLSMFFKTD